MKRRIWAACAAYGALLAAFTAYVLLDTFVIARPYAAAQGEAMPAAQGDAAPLLAEGGVLHTYDEGGVSVTVTAYRGFDSDIYVADVTLRDPAQLRTALAQDAYGRNIRERPTDMAARHGAILAVNGDYYGAQERGYVLRNGVLYRASGADGRQALAIGSDGGFAIVNEGETPLAALAEGGAAQVLSFGPALVQGGAICVDEGALRGKDTAPNPRTAIAHMGGLRYLFVVADGRTRQSAGLTIPELAQAMQFLGAQTAYNLDGGGSSCMVFGGEVVNTPTTNGGRTREREVSDIVYIGL